jgi:hypothetical protein
VSNLRFRAFCVLSVLMIAASATRTSAAEAGSFEVRHLHPIDASLLLQVRVPEARDCKLTPVSFNNPGSAGASGVIKVECNVDGVAAKIEKALAEIDVLPPSQEFHVVVLTASRKEGSTPTLSASEAKALGDFTKVMNFRSYEVEAEAAVQCDKEVGANLSGAYSLNMAIDPPAVGDATIHVREFTLAVGNPKILVINTSFSIRRGETVVLGTSTSDQTARVVLVTALP